jgi:hypothetical protein
MIYICEQFLCWRMPSSEMWSRVDLIITNISEICVASIFRVEIYQSTANAFTHSQIFLPLRWRLYVPPKRLFSQDPHDATSHKAAVFILTAVKPSNPNFYVSVYFLRTLFLNILYLWKRTFHTPCKNDITQLRDASFLWEPKKSPLAGDGAIYFRLMVVSFGDFSPLLISHSKPAFCAPHVIFPHQGERFYYYCVRLCPVVSRHHSPAVSALIVGLQGWVATLEFNTHWKPTLNICSFVHQCNTFTFYFLLLVDTFRPHTAIFKCYSVLSRSCKTNVTGC